MVCMEYVIAVSAPTQLPFGLQTDQTTLSSHMKYLKLLAGMIVKPLKLTEFGPEVTTLIETG